MKQMINSKIVELFSSPRSHILNKLIDILYGGRTKSFLRLKHSSICIVTIGYINLVILLCCESIEKIQKWRLNVIQLPITQLLPDQFQSDLQQCARVPMEPTTLDGKMWKKVNF